MGRKKIKKPVKKTVMPENRRVIPPGLQYALTMANVQFEAEKKARRIVATEKVVDELQRKHFVATENWFYALMALALHDEGFGAKRILRVCEKIRDYHQELNDPEFSDTDIWKMVAEEVGLAFDPDIDGMVRI